MALLGGLMILSSPAWGGDVSFEALVDRRVVELGSFLQLNLRVENASDLDPIKLPDLDGFAARYLGPSTRISIVNGKTTSAVSYIYNLYPTRTGTLTIPPFLIVYKNQEYQTQPIEIEVVESGAGTGAAATQGSSSVGLEDKIFLRLSIPKKEVFVQQKVPVTVRLYVNGLKVRNIQYPEFRHEGFVIEDYQEPGRGSEVINGRSYQYFEFKTQLYPTRSGTLTLGPTKQICEIAFQQASRRSGGFGGFFDEDFFNNFFDTYDTRPVTIESNALELHVKPLPEGQPEDFSAAVGRFDFEVQVSPRRVKEGDPVTVRMVVRGDGNLERIKMPAYTESGLPSKEFKIYEPDVTIGDGSKYIEQVVIPKKTSVKELPAAAFSYFDVDKAFYRTIVRGPFKIDVEPLGRDEQSRVVGLDGKIPSSQTWDEKVGHDILYIKRDPGQWQRRGYRLYRQPFFMVAFLAYLGLWAALWKFHGFRQRLRTDQRFARRLLAPRQARRGLAQAQDYLKKGERLAFYDAVFKVLQDYLGNKFHLPPGSINRQSVEQALGRRRLEGAVLDKMEAVLRQCEMVRYASAEADQQGMQQCYEQTREVIDFFERI